LKRSASLVFTFIAVLLSTSFIIANETANADDEIRQMFKQAAKLTRAGSLAEAEKVLRQAVQLAPLRSDAKLELAFVLIKERILGEAYDLSFAVAQAEPQNAHAFSVLGTTLLNAGRFSEARVILFNALKLDRKESMAWCGFGLLDFYENHLDESMTNLQEAVFRAPDEPDYIFALAQVSARAEKYAEAAEAYSRFLVMATNSADDRRARIKGLINFLRYLGQKEHLYLVNGEQTSVGFELVGNRPVVKLKINKKDEPLNFVLDTGSGMSVISEKTAARLKIKAVTKGGHAKGLGGDGQFEVVYGFVRQMDIGNVYVKNVPVYIRKFHNDGQEVDGYIGLSLISKFLATIDYGTQKFSLTRKDADTRTFRENTALSLPLRLTSSGFLSGEVKLEGVESPLNFIVDTGATVSVISHRVANQKGISQFVNAEKLRVIGSAGITDEVPTFLLPRVTFGTHSRKSVVAVALDLDLINEAAGFEQSGILGGNFLKNYRLTFDFKNAKVTFTSITPDQ
jgi:thioredoxin-like negative regulator of GroEL/predicted aspartyl protease